MKQTFLDKPEDMEWLWDVHGVWTADHECAIVHGNLDCPEKVELFEKNHVDCKPEVWTMEDGRMTRHET